MERHSAQVFVQITNPKAYPDAMAKVNVFRSFAKYAEISEYSDEADARCFMYHLIGEGFNWIHYERDAKAAREIIAATINAEINCNLSDYKRHTKFSFMFGQLSRRKNGSIAVLLKDAELKGQEPEGEPVGRGFLTDIWNNNLEEITAADIRSYAKPFIETVKRYPEAAKIVDARCE
jgi:hypothetical protein